MSDKYEKTIRHIDAIAKELDFHQAFLLDKTAHVEVVSNSDQFQEEFDAPLREVIALFMRHVMNEDVEGYSVKVEFDAERSNFKFTCEPV